MPSGVTGSSASGQGAYQFYVSVEGSRQGVFQGGRLSGEGAGLPGGGPPGTRIPAIRFSYEVVAAPASSSAGKGAQQYTQQYQPVTITKEWGAASPQFYTAAVTNEVLKSVLFEFVATTPTGKQDVYYTIKLTNASIVNFKQYTANLPEGGTQTFELEDVSFTFQKMDIQNQAAGTAASGDQAVGRVPARLGALLPPQISPVMYKSPALGAVIPGTFPT